MIYSVMASFLVLAVITIVLVVASRKPASGLGPSRFPPGTRAFEAELSIPLIGSYIAAREVALASADEAERGKLTKQIENLRAQAAIHQATIEAGDVSPGKMSIGVNPDSPTVD